MSTLANTLRRVSVVLVKHTSTRPLSDLCRPNEELFDCTLSNWLSRAEEFETVFKKFDSNGDGKISTSELADVLSGLVLQEVRVNEDMAERVVEAEVHQELSSTVTDQQMIDRAAEDDMLFEDDRDEMEIDEQFSAKLVKLTFFNILFDSNIVGFGPLCKGGGYELVAVHGGGGTKMVAVGSGGRTTMVALVGGEPNPRLNRQRWQSAMVVDLHQQWRHRWERRRFGRRYIHQMCKTQKFEESFKTTRNQVYQHLVGGIDDKNEVEGETKASGDDKTYLHLNFSNGLNFTVIGSDTSYLPAPVVTPTLLLSPAEIYDVIVDFNATTASETILQNDAPSYHASSM
ncbi:hypothetical protein QJS10_CPB12g00327 [Acorus calamus]|uniref:EF-hand domain-containing protein n=1 Tax=Acorus calamus TaxID=4465 RepID=A0AAV9DS31_ACOCL|nr:hypothetical protein QJS10_CPB12g00327 [Acorus calamus]